jgi:carbon-monoxide dehydrogenase medium subunit
MKPPRFSYHCPESVEEALDLLAEFGDEAAVLAGGQSLMPMLSLRIALPERIIDINRLGELSVIDAADGGLRLGAMVRQRAALASGEAREGCPLLADALPLVGHAETRNRGTIGGSLAHADPVAELPAVAVALDAQIVLSSRMETRVLSADEFFVAPFMSARTPAELVREVRLPEWPVGTGSSFQELAPRHNDLALVGVAALVRLDPNGTIVEARLAYAGGGGVPVRAREAERSLVGRAAGGDAFAETASVVIGELDPPSDVLASAAYRRHAASVLTHRALSEAASRARGDL